MNTAPTCSNCRGKYKRLLTLASVYSSLTLHAMVVRTVSCHAYLLIVEAVNLRKRVEDDVTLAMQLLGKLTLKSFEICVHDRRQVVHILTLRLPQILQRVSATDSAK